MSCELEGCAGPREAVGFKFLWLGRRLTKEELERRSKESQLSEVGGKAVEAEEQVKVLRQRINEMEGQMKKTEEVYKEQVVICSLMSPETSCLTLTEYLNIFPPPFLF